MKRAAILLCLLGSIALLTSSERTVRLRSAVELFKGSGAWQQVETAYPLPLDKTAIILCDMWDKHWCRGATDRVGKLVERMEPFLAAARRQKLLIIHAPSETMAFYAEAPQRKAMLAFEKRATPEPLALSDPPLPIDDRDGGCDTSGDKFYKAWTRQHPGLTIGAEDLISDNGQEVYAALAARGITHLLVAGVHTNMCILNRSFAIRQMTKWGLKCILIRDLTDAMYDPADRPFVTHDAGTQLVIEHIERHWAPSVTSAELLRSWRSGK